MATIILADDHHVVRQSLRLLLEAETDFQIVGEAASGLETIEMVEQVQPDVLILDIMMPELNGLEVTRQVKRRSPKTVVVILSMHENEAYVVEALKAGVTAFVLKKSTAQELIYAIRQGLVGHLFLSPQLNERAIEVYVQKTQETEINPFDTLTAREREVLYLAVEGMNYREIGALLSISPRTVEMHHHNVMRKLRLRNQTDLIRYAIQQGILPLNE